MSKRERLARQRRIEQMTSSDVKAQLRKRLANPVWFAEKVLGHETWEIQRKMLRSIQSHNRISIKSCHASSKTYSAAEAVLWWIVSQKRGVSVTTSPSWTQVKQQIWGEIRLNVERSKWTFPTPNITSLTFSPENYALGLSTNAGVRFHGFHGDVFIVLDESPGIKSEIWDAIEAIRSAGNVKVLAIGNPTDGSGNFFETFGSQRGTGGSDGWANLTISAFDTPNLIDLRGKDEHESLERLMNLPEHELDVNPYPFLISRRWVQERLREWGADHPMFEARILGKFPSQSESALVAISWLEGAEHREQPEISAKHIPKYRGGVDVAGPGKDETVVCLGQGEHVVSMQSWMKADPRGEVVAYFEPYADRGELECINVDAVGIGWNFARHLEDVFGPKGVVIQNINVGSAPSDRKFENYRAELYWDGREAIRTEQASGLTYPKLFSQLSTIRYDITPSGKIRIEPKANALRRGVKSPDWADAYFLMRIAPKRAPLVAAHSIEKMSLWVNG